MRDLLSREGQFVTTVIMATRELLRRHLSSNEAKKAQSRLLHNGLAASPNLFFLQWNSAKKGSILIFNAEKSASPEKG
jgi:hypothetical protein